MVKGVELVTQVVGGFETFGKPMAKEAEGASGSKPISASRTDTSGSSFPAKSKAVA
jgi:hypothetical protein